MRPLYVNVALIDTDQSVKPFLLLYFEVFVFVMDFDEESRMLSFSVPLTDTQVLTVTLKLRTPESGSTFYTISGWKTVNTAGWTADTRQNVYVQTESADAEGE